MDSQYGWRKASYSNQSGNCVEVGQWRTASYSNASGQCVEVGRDADVIAVRDTKDRDSGALTFSAGAWAAFTASLR
jgi:hypothetical protein